MPWCDVLFFQTTHKWISGPGNGCWPNLLDNVLTMLVKFQLGDVTEFSQGQAETPAGGWW